MRRLHFILLTSCLFSPATAFAQSAPWTTPLRGSWVRTGPAAAGDVVIAARDRVTDLVVGTDENSAVRQAAQFLADDIQRISGYRPAIVTTAAANRTSVHLVTLGNGELPPGIDTAALKDQWEGYRIVTHNEMVWLVGSNPRGTAYAAYTLSERLGVDPLYIWTGYRPEHHDPLILKPTTFTQPPPAFRYRGLFHDDEDLLPRPFDANGYPLQTGDVPLAWYKRFFETALRLRMNMVAPYTRVHRRYEVQKLASDWGLYYTSHHYDILLSNPWGLERFNLAAERGVRPEYNWFTNRDGMLKFWRAGVLQNRDLDAIWPVGMRGTQDRPFTFPAGITDDEKAQTFRDVIREQVEMVHDLLPNDKTPLFHFTMYSEMLPQYQRNPAAFDLPSDVIIVWPDDNDGHMRGLPSERGRWKHGVYYHLAYLGGKLTKQLTHTVRPAVVAEQFDNIVKSGATEYMLVNVSEVRDYVMCTRMLADITWDAQAIYVKPDAARRFTEWWAHEYFGNAAGAAAEAYNEYFGLLNTPDTLWAAPDAIEDLLERLHRKVLGESYAEVNADIIALMHSRNQQLQHALDTLSRAEHAMTLSQQRFFSIDVALGLQVAQRQTQAALYLDQALRAADAEQMWRSIQQAREPLEQLEVELARGEYPPFDRWYQESWIRNRYSQSNPHRPYIQVRAFIASEGMSPVTRAARR